MEFLRALAGIRTDFLSVLMSAVTHLGEETFFILAGLLLYWCFSKEAGRYIMVTGFIGTSLSQAMKLLFRIPRPWILDPEFEIVESARAAATGYSFPSGHSQTAVGVYGGIALWTKKKWLKAVMIAVAVIVPFSRMYLGVHTPLDVGIGCLISLVLIFALYPMMLGKNATENSVRTAMYISLILSAAYVLYAALFPFPADMDKENLAHGIANGWTMLGANAGMLIATELDNRRIHFSVKAPLTLQLVKIIPGLAITLLLKSALKSLFAAITPSPAMNALRYFLVVLFAAAAWPAIIEFLRRKFWKVK